MVDDIYAKSATWPGTIIGNNFNYFFINNGGEFSFNMSVNSLVGFGMHT